MVKRAFEQKSNFEILDHGINYAIKLAKKTLKSQFSGISTGTNTEELSLFFCKFS